MILWFFNYYSQTIDNTMQTATSAISYSLLASSWKDLKFQINQFFTMQPLTIMPKFDIVLFKITYGFK